MRSCPKCGQPGQGPPPCSMCGWHPEPPAAETVLLVGEQVIMVRWKQVAGVPVAEQAETRSLWEWLHRRAAQ